MNFLPIQYDPAALRQYGALFAACFPNASGFTEENLDWLYCRNPDGQAIGFDAWEGDQLAAHYVCVPARVALGGTIVKAMLSLNTATHPDFQGKGLFTKLAALTYEAGAAAGFDCVFGVANGNSTGGFVRKLGFQLVQPLEARIGLGGLGINLGQAARAAQFARTWSAQSLAWRCANPKNPVSSRKHGDRMQFYAAAKGMILPVYAELDLQDTASIASDTQRFLSPTRLFIGLVPGNACRFQTYVSIPQRLRPSPLNFIYRSLSGRIASLEQGQISFSFLDFDAF